ncbi:ABC transporter ATP-binding protein [Heliorestis acidaminivorans]|uniref:ABC transporter ATP-binding protein n=1 Tax=Heliorestis acidaminivorans TaxID=553427 RepID=UPI001A9B5B5C|nr:ABC transporter ATP-binding protein [Heliorestis acidaminivorans]
MLEVRQVSQIYGKKERRRHVLDRLDLQIEAGEFVAVTGPSGCGKTTLLCILGALLQPTSGEVWLDGQLIRGINEAELADLRAQKIGFVFQFPALLPTLTLLENILLPLTFSQGKGRSREDGSRAIKLLEQVGLAGREKDLPFTLSGGEQRRVAVARALINRPQILLADEPTGALDQGTGERLIDLLETLNETEGLTLVLATHDALVARRARREVKL